MSVERPAMSVRGEVSLHGVGMSVEQTAMAVRGEVSLHGAGNLTAHMRPTSEWATMFIAIFAQKQSKFTVPICVRKDTPDIHRDASDAHIEHLLAHPANSADCLPRAWALPIKIATVHAFHPGTKTRDQIHSLTTNIVPGNGMHERGVLNAKFDWTNDAFVIWHEKAEITPVKTFDVKDGSPDLDQLRSDNQVPVNFNGVIKANAWHPPTPGEEYNKVLSLYNDVVSKALQPTPVGLHDVYSYQGNFGIEAWCLVSLSNNFAWTGCKNVHAVIEVAQEETLNSLQQRFGCQGCGGFDPLRFDWGS